MKHTESKEMYLEVIYDIYLRDEEIRSIDIAKTLGYTKPSVNRGVNLLKEMGMVTQEPYGVIYLTNNGIDAAKEIKERHILLTQFLQHSLGLSDTTAECDACKIEHVVSNETMEAVKAYLEKSN